MRVTKEPTSQPTCSIHPPLTALLLLLRPGLTRCSYHSESNYGDFRKTKWSRSSRTDKGVHSLATVIGLRILMKDEDYETGTALISS